MRRAKTEVWLLSVCLLVVLSVVPVSAQPPPLPHAFYGTVEINRQPAPVGAQVEGRGAEVQTGVPGNPLTVAAAGRYGGPGGFEPKLVVQGHVADGTPIEFYVNGVRAQCAVPGGPWQDSYPFKTGSITELNLRVDEGATPPGQTRTPTPVQPTATPTRPSATRTPTPVLPTATPGQPTATPTLVVPTATAGPGQPTVTPTLVVPTATATPGEPTATPTPVLPTATSLATSVPTPTGQATMVPTPTVAKPTPLGQGTTEAAPTRVVTLPAATSTAQAVPVPTPTPGGSSGGVPGLWAWVAAGLLVVAAAVMIVINARRRA